MGSIQTLEPTWALIRRPPGYTATPAPGKIQQIWTTNASNLYHRLSPYSNYDENSGLLTWGNQPFYYIFPDENNKGINALKKHQSQQFPIGDAPIDVIRVSKFMVSGAGVSFLAKQFLLQTGNAYNETRIYNPTSPIVAAGMSLALGAVRPTRFIDLYGGLGGIAQSLLGGVGSLIPGANTIQPPPGTVGKSALPTATAATGGKGLLRAGTANRGLANLQAAWPPSGNGASLTSTFGSIVKNLVTSLFANFIPATQGGVKFRSDENAYGLMIAAGANKFQYQGQSGPLGFSQLFVGGSKAGGSIMRKKDEYSSDFYRLYNGLDFGRYPIVVKISVAGGKGTVGVGRIPGVGAIGYSIQDSGKPQTPGFRYGDSVGESVSTRQGEDYTNSDIMVQYGFYSNPSRQYDFPTKQSNPTSQVAVNYNAELQKILTGPRSIPNIGNGNIYTMTIPKDSKVISSPDRSADGYNELFLTTNGQKGISAINYLHGVLSNYRTADREIQTVDESLKMGNNTTKKLPTNGTFDGINTLEVLDSTRTITNFNLRGWPKWEPYKDDLIAFFFYDVVNEKYIPFRAAIKDVAESGNATWEEMTFIGRADKLYSYGGFNRSLNFGVKIVISSIVELAPTWQRINYMCTSIKPANYTVANLVINNNVAFNRFMVPPMFMLTMGDLYKDQPILIQSITTTIPTDAAWETLNEFNMDRGQLDWNYLAGIIKAPNVVVGQLPREVELGFNCVLLEKERAVVGGANFGHAPRVDDWTTWNEWKDGVQGMWNTNTVPNPGPPNQLHKSLVVNVIDTSAPPQTTAASPAKPVETPRAPTTSTPTPTPSTPPTFKPPSPALKPVTPQLPSPTSLSNTNNVAPPFGSTVATPATPASPLQSPLRVNLTP